LFYHLFNYFISYYKHITDSPESNGSSSSEGAKVLIDDAVQALKVNDTEKPTVHLNIPNQQAANICKFNFISISRGNHNCLTF
jgi:hypothetical protein